MQRRCSQSSGGTVLVALEEPQGSQTDVIFMQTVADSGRQLQFCPLPTAATFDVVVVAINGAGLVYNATVAVGVLGGTNLGAIPLTPETGATPGPATLRGFVSAGNGSAAATIDASVSALQTITLPSGAALAVTIPAENNSVSNISVDSNADCPATAPMNTNCAQYTLIEPASNPSVGVFSSGKITYSAPAFGRCAVFGGRECFCAIERRHDRLRTAIKNHQPRRERKSFEGERRSDGHATGNRFSELFVVRLVADHRSASHRRRILRAQLFTGIVTG